MQKKSFKIGEEMNLQRVKLRMKRKNIPISHENYEAFSAFQSSHYFNVYFAYIIDPSV